jgi:predicted enzyme involved in methoxymalonyl-ACP biosynthesis
MPAENKGQTPTVKNVALKRIVIASTFTAEPVEESLKFWQQKLMIPYGIQFAPYNQVYQQLLDPKSLFSKNSDGLNVILLRLQDWVRKQGTPIERLSGDDEKRIRESIQDLIAAVETASYRPSSPYLICFCPKPPSTSASETETSFHKQMEQLALSKLGRLNNVHFLTSSEMINSYPVSTCCDRVSDELGHVPYTREYFAAIGTMIVRKFRVLANPPHKVIALDCDNTLWNGVCGEDGPLGVRIDPPWE